MCAAGNETEIANVIQSRSELAQLKSISEETNDEIKWGYSRGLVANAAGRCKIGFYRGVNWGWNGCRDVWFPIGECGVSNKLLSSKQPLSREENLNVAFFQNRREVLILIKSKSVLGVPFPSHKQ